MVLSIFSNWIEFLCDNLLDPNPTSESVYEQRSAPKRYQKWGLRQGNVFLSDELDKVMFKLRSDQIIYFGMKECKLTITCTS